MRDSEPIFPSIGSIGCPDRRQRLRSRSNGSRKACHQYATRACLRPKRRQRTRPIGDRLTLKTNGIYAFECAGSINGERKRKSRRKRKGATSSIEQRSPDYIKRSQNPRRRPGVNWSAPWTETPGDARINWCWASSAQSSTNNRVVGPWVLVGRPRHLVPESIRNKWDELRGGAALLQYH